MRRLHIRWMIAGHGGWEEKRIDIPLPSPLLVALVAYLLFMMALLWKEFSGQPA